MVGSYEWVIGILLLNIMLVSCWVVYSIHYDFFIGNELPVCFS